MTGIQAAWRWWRPGRARDAVLAVALAVALVSGSYGEGHPHSPSDRLQFQGHPIPHPPLAALLLVAVACLALAWRRRWPLAVLGVSAGAVFGYTLLGYVNGAALLAPAFALYAVATRASPRQAVTAAVVTLGALMAATGAMNPFGKISGGGFYLIPAMVAAALFGGIAVANRRAYVASIQARADDAARRRIDEERLRIARELHDVVAHTMATINVQAGAAAHVAAERPEAVVEALRTIKEASRAGLRELRAILNVLRQADEPDAVFPAPGLAQIDALISSARSAGLAATLSVTGSPRPLPSEVNLAAYRIVQESLTNAIRHAGPASAAVSLAYAPSELRIEVADTGLGALAGPAADVKGDEEERTGRWAGGGGHGLPGMRERAVSVGGSLEAGPAPEGGFRVTARLPLGQGPPARHEEPASAAEGSRP